jgi:hypothetical protein
MASSMLYKWCAAFTNFTPSFTERANGPPFRVSLTQPKKPTSIGAIDGGARVR